MLINFLKKILVFEFNSKNIHEFNSVAKDGDEIFLSCLPATKWIVNKNIC